MPFVSKIRGFYSGQNASIFLAVNPFLSRLIQFLSRLIQFLSRFDFSRGRGDSGSNIFNNSRTLELLP